MNTCLQNVVTENSGTERLPSMREYVLGLGYLVYSAEDGPYGGPDDWQWYQFERGLYCQGRVQYTEEESFSFAFEDAIQWEMEKALQSAVLAAGYSIDVPRDDEPEWVRNGRLAMRMYAKIFGGVEG